MNVFVGGALLAIFLLTGFNAFLTLAETALITVRQARLQQMVREGSDSHSVDRVQEMIREPTRVFATVQVGITLASFSVAAIAIAILGPALARALSSWQLPHDVQIAAVLLTLLSALFTIIVGELVPRAIAQRNPERIALFVVAPLRVCMILLAPLASIALALSNVLVRPFGLTATYSVPIITEEELRTLLEASAQSGAIEHEEKEIIRNVISFADKDTRQVMTPRIDIKATDVTTGLQALIRLIMDSGHSRIPIYEGSVDNIVGIVHAKDLLPALERGEHEIELRRIARQPLVVSENKPVDSLLAEFRRTQLQLAIVQDEYGGTAGLVTIEDLLEELIGEINDEYDTEESMVRMLDTQTALIDGRMRIEDVNEQMGTDFPQEDFDTLGGYLFGLFGHLPRVGESVVHEGIELSVENIDGHRVGLIRFVRCPATEETASDAPDPDRA